MSQTKAQLIDAVDGSIVSADIADQAVTLDKLPHGTSSNNGKFLRANNGADPSFETVTTTTINNNAANRVMTGEGGTTLNGEANFTYDGTKCLIGTATAAPFINRNLTVTQGGSGNTTVAIEVRSPTNGDGRIIFTDSTDSSNSGSYRGQIMYDQTNDFFQFGTGGAVERMRITNDGRVGIGDNSPDTALHVKSADNVLATFESTDADALIEFKDNGTSDNILMGALGGDDLLLRCDAGSIIFNTSNNAEKARFDASGRLLISGQATLSSTSLTHRLQVRAQNDSFSLALIGRNGDHIATQSFYQSDATTEMGRIIVDTSTFTTRSQNHMTFQTAGANERMRIDSGGTVLIGSTTDIGHSNADNLQVGSGSGSNGITIYSGNDANGSLYFGDGSSGADAYRGFIEYSHSGNNLFFGTNGSTTTKIDSDGHFCPNADNSKDLGTTSLRWRNLYTTDLKLSNEGSQNDVDSTWGNYTIQEGHEDLFLINHRTNKKFKFNLTEVV
tara:strand:+ start:16 stop:1521 length:1506 start_codon:yes stop_codon:yes gene_type:complete